MSEQPVDMPEQEYAEGQRRKRRSPLVGCLAALVVLALVLGFVWFALTRGVEWVSDKLDGSAEDYPGPGTGRVVFEVSEGDTTAEMGRNLKEEGVVASVDAFIAVAQADPEATGIQVGYYPMKEKMAAADALEVLTDPDNIMSNAVTIPEGLRVDDIVELLGEQTDFDEQQWRAALDDTRALGLPSYADGNPEGYLFPATYDIGPKDKPVDVLKAMVDRWRQAADEAGLEESAERVGKTPAELMVIASLIEAEGRGDDMAKISRVIYNRLDGPGDKGGTNGLLQIDASVNYALDRTGTTAISTDEIESVSDSPYNTYKHPGLPPTPIEAPGDAAIEAAAHPAEGDWYYYVTVDLKTGETKFAETYDEFLEYKAEYQDYCTTSDAC